MFFTHEEKERSRAVFAFIADLPSRLDGVCLFGAGMVGQSLLTRFREAGISVSHFIDNNPSLRGCAVQGLPVRSLDEHVAKHADKPLVLSLAGGLREVRRQCVARGLNPIPQYLCRSAFGLCPFSKKMTAEQIEAEPEAARADALWADDASRDKYRALIRFQALFDDEQLPPPEPGHYFASGYMPARFLRSVVDVGACSGETLRDFLHAVGDDFDSYTAFEPDPGNYRILESGMTRHETKIRLFNLGLGDRRETLRFNACGNLLSHVDGNGETAIQVDTLDQVLALAPQTLIKIDVEGFEPAVLSGMRETLRLRRPALAVSIYHQVDHLWALPLWIHDLCPDYSFRLACHGDLYSEAVCYALPKET